MKDTLKSLIREFNSLCNSKWVWSSTPYCGFVFLQVRLSWESDMDTDYFVEDIRIKDKKITRFIKKLRIKSLLIDELNELNLRKIVPEINKRNAEIRDFVKRANKFSKENYKDADWIWYKYFWK